MSDRNLVQKSSLGLDELNKFKKGKSALRTYESV